MQINQQLVRFSPALTEEINKNVLKTLNLCEPLFSERKPSINRVKIILKLTEKYTDLTKVNQGSQRFSPGTETFPKFNQVKPRLDKLNREINRS